MELNVKKAVFLLVILLAGNARATTIDFGCITDNDPSGLSCDIAGTQMALDIKSFGDEQVLFSFSNTGLIDSFIANVYFMYDDLDFLIFNSILNPDLGVSFSESSHPSHLPAYDSRQATFSAGSDPGGRSGNKGGRNRNGINAQESLDILFDLDQGTFDDVLAALQVGDLVIGIHVQGLGEGNEYSESLMATSQAVVPVPAAVWLFGSGLLVLLGLSRRLS